MPLTVEFFGIARQRAGIARVEVEAGNVGEAFDRLASLLPHWADACLYDGQLQRTFMANLNARQFISERSHPVRDGDCLLILSADSGG